MIERAIGGYFEFELLSKKVEVGNNMLFNSGRSAFAFLLMHYNISKIQLPSYTCDVILEPLKALGIQFSFYSIANNLLPDFSKGEIDLKIPMVINNYFGILDEELEHFSSNPLVIIDSSQGLYSKAIGGMGSFNSFRKFIGIPDGAEAKTYGEGFSNTAYSWPSYKASPELNYLFGRIEDGPEAYFEDFKHADECLTFKEIKSISEISKRVFFKIDHENIKKSRRQNFSLLHNSLASINKLALTASGNCVPLVYPLLLENGNKLKKHLIANKVFTPTYWPNKEIKVLENSFEKCLTDNLVALPIDQRYGEVEMKEIMDIIKVYNDI